MSTPATQPTPEPNSSRTDVGPLQPLPERAESRIPSHTDPHKGPIAEHSIEHLDFPYRCEAMNSGCRCENVAEFIVYFMKPCDPNHFDSVISCETHAFGCMSDKNIVIHCPTCDNSWKGPIFSFVYIIESLDNRRH